MCRPRQSLKKSDNLIATHLIHWVNETTLRFTPPNNFIVATFFLNGIRINAVINPVFYEQSETGFLRVLGWVAINAVINPVSYEQSKTGFLRVLGWVAIYLARNPVSRSWTTIIAEYRPQTMILFWARFCYILAFCRACDYCRKRCLTAAFG